MNRAGQPAQTTNSIGGPNTSASPRPQANTNNSKKKAGRNLPFNRISTVILLFSSTIILLGLVWLIAMTKDNNEAKFVDSSKMQAVFLNGGQVYFGRINALNNDYVRVNDIYYLRVNQQVQPGDNQQAQQDISLVKLGCELHGPEDQMLINREQVVFWENLKQDGQVTRAIEEYRRANPNGQSCETEQQQNNQQGAPAGQEQSQNE